jgi:hypothetical protein
MKTILVLLTAFLITFSSLASERTLLDRWVQGPMLETTVGFVGGTSAMYLSGQDIKTSLLVGVALGGAGYFIFDHYDEKYGNKEKKIFKEKEKIINEMVMSMSSDVPDDYPVKVRPVYVPGTRRSDGSIEEGSYEFYLEGRTEQGSFLRGN